MSLIVGVRGKVMVVSLIVVHKGEGYGGVPDSRA